MPTAEKIASPLRSLSERIFNNPFLYKSIRSFFLGGLPDKPVIRLIASTEQDVILDIGCGMGDLAAELRFKNYIGIDNDPAVIRIAKSRNIPNTQFLETDIRDFDFSKLRVTKAVLYGFLHHLDDRAAVELLNFLCGIVQDSLITLDPVYSEGHWINNLLCRLDRGEYVRTPSAMDALIAQTRFRVDTRLLHSANTRIAQYLSYRLLPPVR
jgi:SAM-dependent methyltransferase